MEYFCKRGDPFRSEGLSKNKPLLVKVRYDSMFALCLHLITIPSTIHYNVFTMQF